MRKFLCKMLNNINKSLNIDEKFCEKSEKKLAVKFNNFKYSDTTI
jgi:hypothetical protein